MYQKMCKLISIAIWFLLSNSVFAQNSLKEMKEIKTAVSFCRGETTNVFTNRRTGKEKVTKEYFSGNGYWTSYEKFDGTHYIDVQVPGASISELSSEMLFRIGFESIRGYLTNAEDFSKTGVSFKMNARSGEFETVRWYANVYGKNEETSKGICSSN